MQRFAPVNAPAEADAAFSLAHAEIEKRPTVNRLFHLQKRCISIRRIVPHEAAA